MAGTAGMGGTRGPRGPYKGSSEYSAGWQAYGRGWARTSAQVIARDHGICAYCGGRADTADHVVAKANGGTDDLWNLVAACRPCNSSKGDRDAPGPGRAAPYVVQDGPESDDGDPVDVPPAEARPAPYIEGRPMAPLHLVSRPGGYPEYAGWVVGETP